MRASVYSGLYGFVPLAWIALTVVPYSWSNLWNETRNARIHHRIQPLSGLNSIDFVKRVFRKGRDVEILSRAGRRPGRGKQSRAALHTPSQQDLCRCLSNSRGDGRNDGILERPRPHPVTQWRKGQKHNTL